HLPRLPSFPTRRSSDLRPLPAVNGSERGRFAGRHTLVVGAGHSAANTLLDLTELAQEAPGTRISWAVRSADATRAFGGEGDDQRSEEHTSELQSRFDLV